MSPQWSACCRKVKFEVVVSLTKGKPLAHRKSLAYLHFPRAPVKYSLNPKDFKYLENSKLPQHKPQSGAKRGDAKGHAKTKPELNKLKPSISRIP